MSNDTQFALVEGRRIAFQHLAYDDGGPTFVFLPGYKSDMSGTKAFRLYDHCYVSVSDCLLLDYSGCGESNGDFADGSLSRWRDEVVALIEAKLTGSKIVLVGSSMGGWLMLHVGMALGDRLAGMIGIASAPDFSDWGYSDEQKARLRNGETVYESNPYGPEPTPTHPKFWQDAERLKVLDQTIPIVCPTVLLHGADDTEVPPEISFRLAEALASSDVEVILVEGGDHRLSRPSNLNLLIDTVMEFERKLW